MIYHLNSRKNAFLAVLLAVSFGANAQITSQHTDDKYNFTTVVYKDKAASDDEVLAALNNSVGMGDVIRVTVAPPKPPVAPMIDVSKGEDVWLTARSKPSVTLSASTSTMPAVAVASSVESAQNQEFAAPVINEIPEATPVAVVAVENTHAVTEAQEQKLEEVKTTSTSSKQTTARSAKKVKSSKRFYKPSRKVKKRSFKLKLGKKGKLRYGCPTF